MHDWATSTDSESSELIVPSLREVDRKSMIARAKRFFDSDGDDWICQLRSRNALSPELTMIVANSRRRGLSKEG